MSRGVKSPAWIMLTNHERLAALTRPFEAVLGNCLEMLRHLESKLAGRTENERKRPFSLSRVMTGGQDGRNNWEAIRQGLRKQKMSNHASLFKAEGFTFPEPVWADATMSVPATTAACRERF